MSAAVVEPGDEWSPNTRSCPKWCDGDHAAALAERNGWERSQIHHKAGGEEVLCELTYAGRAVREWGGGWELTAEQRPLDEHGGYWGPPLILLNISMPGTLKDSEINLTSGDALLLARHLMAMVDRLET